MRAIIIDDKDARALIEMLAAEKGRLKERLEKDEQHIAHEIHRRFHYVVTIWLQEQGASTTGAG